MGKFANGSVSVSCLHVVLKHKSREYTWRNETNPHTVVAIWWIWINCLSAPLTCYISALCQVGGFIFLMALCSYKEYQDYKSIVQFLSLGKQGPALSPLWPSWHHHTQILTLCPGVLARRRAPRCVPQQGFWTCSRPFYRWRRGTGSIFQAQYPARLRFWAQFPRQDIIC